MGKYNKQRLFEVMGKVDSTFKRKLNEDVQLQPYDDSEPATYLSDYDERLYSHIEKMYPNFSHIAIVEKFIPNQGWVNCNLSLSEETIDKLIGEGVTQVNLKVTEGKGNSAYPDYSMEEFKNLKNN